MSLDKFVSLASAELHNLCYALSAQSLGIFPFRLPTSSSIPLVLLGLTCRNSLMSTWHTSAPKLCRQDHTKPFLYILHWFYVQAFVKYKLDTLRMLCSISLLNLPHYTPNRHTSADTCHLSIPRIRTKTCGLSISHSALTCWNSLP